MDSPVCFQASAWVPPVEGAHGEAESCVRGTNGHVHVSPTLLSDRHTRSRKAKSAASRMIPHLNAEIVSTKAALPRFSIQSKIQPFLEAPETVTGLTCKHEDLSLDSPKPHVFWVHLAEIGGSLGGAYWPVTVAESGSISFMGGPSRTLGGRYPEPPCSSSLDPVPHLWSCNPVVS